MSSSTFDEQDFSDCADGQLVVGTSLWQDAWRRLKKNRMALASAWIVGLMTAACILGPFIIKATWGYDYETQNLEYNAQPPSLQHWFGTDFFGRDLLTRCLYGGQISLLVGILAASVSALIGTLYGAVSGYAGGRVDSMMMRFVDVVYTLPYMFLVILLVTMLGRRISLVFVALGAVSWLTTARIVRGQVLSLREQEFVKAARSVGTPGVDIVTRHLIPNTLGPIIVYFTLTVPAMDSARGIPIVSWTGRSSAAAEPGRTYQRRRPADAGILVDTRFSRRHDGNTAIQSEFPGRRTERCPRSENETIALPFS